MAKHISESVTGPNPTMEAVPIESSGAAKYEIPAKAEETVTRLAAQFSDIEWEIVRFRNEVTLYVPRERIVEVCQWCKSELGFNYLSDLTGNDWPEREARFEVIYHLYSMEHFTRFRLKVRVPEEPCTCPSVTSVWATANWHERETFDLFGIVFEGHPDLRRILLTEEWEGHPLRQDYPIGWEEPEFTVRKINRDYATG